MMRALAFMMVFTRASAANAPISGMATCRCIGALSSTIPREACDHAFAPTGQCVRSDNKYGDIGWWDTYPADYGSQCQYWPEPAQSVCFNNSEAQMPKVPQELLTPMKTWCKDAWCYVDPCKCDAPDAAASSTFESYGEMFYSYAACGEIDAYTGAEAADKVGTGGCEVLTSGASAVHVLFTGVATVAGIMVSV